MFFNDLDERGGDEAAVLAMVVLRLPALRSGGIDEQRDEHGRAKVEDHVCGVMPSMSTGRTVN